MGPKLWATGGHKNNLERGGSVLNPPPLAETLFARGGGLSVFRALLGRGLGGNCVSQGVREALTMAEKCYTLI